MRVGTLVCSRTCESDGPGRPSAGPDHVDICGLARSWGPERVSQTAWVVPRPAQPSSAQPSSAQPSSVQLRPVQLRPAASPVQLSPAAQQPSPAQQLRPVQLNPAAQPSPAALASQLSSAQISCSSQLSLAHSSPAAQASPAPNGWPCGFLSLRPGRCPDPGHGLLRSNAHAKRMSCRTYSTSMSLQTCAN